MSVQITIIDKDSPHLKTVMRLGDANRTTLGFLPQAVFEQTAKDKQILIALDENKLCVGYLLYRVVRTKYHIAITHLCVSQEHRGKGIAKQLVDYLKNLTKDDWLGISLFSRRDYDSNSIWPHLGFEYLGEKKGRGKEQIPLSRYWFDHGHENLFTWADKQKIESKTTQAVIDANVFFNLLVDSDHPLLADWLQEIVVLCVTPELPNEIHRSEDSVKRRHNLEYADTFPIIRRDNMLFKQVHELLQQNYLPEVPKPSDRSDIKQLAYTIAGNAEFFITNDSRLADQVADDIYKEFGVSIVRPDDFIIRLDELMNAAEYQSNRLAGSNISITRITSGQTDLLAKTFQSQPNEKKAHLARNLRDYLSQPRKFDAYIVTDPNENLLALIVYSRQNQDELELPILRIASDSLPPALEAHLVFRSVRQAVNEGRRLIKVSDPYLSQNMTSALIENSFSKEGESWVKLNLAVSQTLSDLSKSLKLLMAEVVDYQNYLQNLSMLIQEASSDKDVSSLLNIERRLWPAKITDAEIPTFIVSIRPGWAMDLFDSHLGRQTLFGSETDLIFKMDNVYYRSSRHKTPLPHSRVLWYVSKHKGKYSNVQTIRACSYVDEVVIGTPKDIFKAFRRLGVYQWRDIFKAVGGDITKEILAFRFSRTELFTTPVPWEELKLILGRRIAPLSPIRISSVQFEQIYGIGTNKGGKT